MKRRITSAARPMDEDSYAAIVMVEREEELRVGVAALTRKMADLERQTRAMRNRLVGPLVGVPIPVSLASELEKLEGALEDCRWGLYDMTASAIGGDHGAADVAAWCRRAVDMGANHPRIDRALLLDLLHVRKVPNEPFRTKADEVISNAEIGTITKLVHRHLKAIPGDHGAASLITTNNGVTHPQIRILKRWLGMETCPASKPSRLPSLRLFVTYEQGLALARALDLDPYQAGL